MGSSVCDNLVFYVNGQKVVEEQADPETTLLQYLRNTLHLTGSKLGCSEGGCGACTVMVSKFDRSTNKIKHYTVNACLAPVCSMHGLAVTTVEGIGSTKTKLHAVQERIAKSHGSQCGFCTPGMVMSMYALLRNNPQPSFDDMEEAFQGNLCRCTGYRPILDGFKTFTKDYQCAMGDQCCKNTTNANADTSNKKGIFDVESCTTYDPSQDVIFPSELQLTDKYDTGRLVFNSDRATWYRPVTLNDVIQIKTQHPAAKLVTGNTEVGVELKYKNMHYPVMVFTSHVKELNKVSWTEEGVTFGGAVTLTTIDDTLKEAVKKETGDKTRVFAAVIDMLRWFAGYQVRNVAAVAGNIMTASPISDLNPMFLAAGCELTVMSKEKGTRKVKMDESFFCGYRKTALSATEVLLDITIPYTHQDQYFMGYKQAHRRDDDIAIVNGGFSVEFESGGNKIKSIRMAYGGMAPQTVMPTKSMKQLHGREWNEEMLNKALELLAVDLLLPAGTPGGMETYRCTLTTSLFFKFYLHVCDQLQERSIDGVQVPDNYQSALPLYHRPHSKGVQLYEEPSANQSDVDPVGRPLPHLSAAKQTTGEAKYIDDMPKFENELYLAFVWSTKAHAEIVSVDASAARKMPGIVDYIDHTDVQGSNVTGHIISDEEVFASKKVVCQGQPIGAILGKTQVEAQRAAKAVKVTYNELTPIITIEQAIAAKSFLAEPRTIQNGDTEKGFSESDHIIEGEVKIGGQEHFYLETMACVVLPKGEDGEVEVFSSTQNPTASQALIAKGLGVSANKVIVRTRRMGGGFGGKESRSPIIEIPLAVAAAKHDVPVRCMLDRDEDMNSTGTRHPFLGRYKVGFTKDGKIKSVDVTLYSNAGYSFDLSAAVLERSLFHSDNCYKVPNMKTTGYLCKTNIPSNTAFRGFGGPQGMFVCEMWIGEMAGVLGTTPEKIREINMYREGELTFYNQKLTNCHLMKCWNQIMEQSNFEQRSKALENFNQKNRWKKRGISIVPVKFGIAYTALFLNQGGALLHIYKDGSVLLTHGGTEMGQGLHTKMIQVASRALGISMDKIHISETGTNTVPNTSPTAASASSDLNGMAIVNACNIINERLKPIKEAKPDGTWEDWIINAYLSRVSLSTTGFYKTPGIGYDWEKNSGHPFNYYTMGAACTEVEIDCLTGDHTALRTDIVMDIGDSLNPAIDIGQIEGGFIQGYGLFTLEEQRYSPDGFLFTKGPGFYKIPGFTDIPIEFNVSLLKGVSNPKAVYSSKAIGEPPLFLACSLFFAIKNAIASARKDAGLSGRFRLDSPATCQRIRMSCEDQFTKQFPEPEEGTYKPWFVVL